MESDHRSDERDDKVRPTDTSQHLDTHDNGNDFGEAGHSDKTSYPAGFVFGPYPKAPLDHQNHRNERDDYDSNVSPLA